MRLTPIPAHQHNFPASVVDAHRQELAALVLGGLLAELGLPMVETALVNRIISTELTYSLATLQERLVDGTERFEVQHMLCLVLQTKVRRIPQEARTGFSECLLLF